MHYIFNIIGNDMEGGEVLFKSFKQLQEEYPEDELYLIVGADIVNSIKDWHEGEWILENFKLITIARQGSEVDAIIKKTINVSSTEIRTLI